MEFIEFIRKWCLTIFWSCDWKTHFCMWMLCLGWGQRQFNISFFFVCLNLCLKFFILLEFQSNGQAFIQSKNIWHRYWKVNAPHFPSLGVFICECVCAHAPIDVHVVGGVVVCVALSSGGTYRRLPRQQCGCHCGSLHRIVSFSSSWNVISSLAASLCIWAHSILLLFSSLLLFLFCSVPLVVLDRLKLL